MDPQHWQHIKVLLNAALERLPEERVDFLKQACGPDSGLFQEVATLMRHHAAAQQFLETEFFGLNSQRVSFETHVELTGSVLDGKYQIDQLLGTGGMGAVYRAIHLGTERPVAIKIISPEFSNTPEFLERFKREAKATGRLRYPNVINVTDFGITTFENQQIAYLVMEFLEGQTLGDLLRKQKQLPLGTILDIVEQICLAIEEAHQQGIIHRDLKPDNIWLEPNRRGGYNVKVLDFGIAKLRLLEPPPSPHSSDQHNTSEIDQIPTLQFSHPELTHVGSILGTPTYMSPEQCNGDAVDERSDIYSLGVMTYQMLAGEPPFSGDSFQLLFKHVEEPPPPLSPKCPHIPKVLATLILETLAKQPEERPPSAKAFRNALRVRAESASQLLSEAAQLFLEHFPTFLKLAACIYFPVAVVHLLLLWSLWHFPLQSFPIAPHHLRTIAIGMWLVEGFLAYAINTAGYTLLTNRFLRGQGSSLRNIFNLLFNHLPGLGLAVLLMWRFSPFDNSLVFSVLAEENLPVTNALQRSQELVQRLASTVIPVQILNFCSLLFFLLAFPITFLISGLWIDFFQTEPVFHGVVRVFHVLFPIALLLLCQSFIGIASALVYCKARQAGGEDLSDTVEPKPISNHKLGMSTLPHTLAFLALLTLVMLLPSLYFVFQYKLLSLTVRNGYEETATSLLVMGMNPNSRKENTPLLCDAVRSGRLSLVKVLLDNGADVNQKDIQGKTALTYARENHRQDMVHLLSQAGAGE